MAKAYDSIEWSFLKSVLQELGFPQKFIAWIKTCVLSVSYYVRINEGSEWLRCFFCLRVSWSLASLRLLHELGFLQGMQSYQAKVFLLPKRIIDMVDQVCNKFIWRTDLKGSKSYIAQKHVCMPRAYSGLNIFNLYLQNEVLLLKSLWDLVSKMGELWINWVHDYYQKGVDIMYFRVRYSASQMLGRTIASRG